MIVYNTQIHALGDPRYRLRRPLLVTMREYEAQHGHCEEIIACVPEFALYGSGLHGHLAVSNLKAEIVCSYERLVALGPDKLGFLPLEHLEAMQVVIEDVSGEG